MSQSNKRWILSSVKLSILSASILMTGCATQDTAVLRVLDYGTGSSGKLFGEVAGCAVHQQANSTFSSVKMHYKGEKCEVVIEAPNPRE